MAKNFNHSRIVSLTDKEQCLDAGQLNHLEQSFRHWVNSAVRADVRRARRRILMIFLLIRYTGAKLSEVLALNVGEDIHFEEHFVTYRNISQGTDIAAREVHIAEALCREIEDTLVPQVFAKTTENILDVDPGFVRRKFYERAEACGFTKRLGGPEMIRKARAVELMRSNMPLPAVQMMLGHSTPTQTSSYVSYAKEEIRRITEIFIKKESSHQTSARNSFFGRIMTIELGTIQARIALQTLDGLRITTIITNDSLKNLDLTQGSFITAEVKAPAVMLHCDDEEPRCSAENRLHGQITRISTGLVNTEYLLSVNDTTDICAIISTARSLDLNLQVGKKAWALFSCFAVVLHAE
jgi:molybdate transport system regulatory protein